MHFSLRKAAAAAAVMTALPIIAAVGTAAAGSPIAGWSLSATTAAPGFASGSGGVADTNDLPFNINVAGTPKCSGDTASGGYSAYGYLVGAGVDASTLSFPVPANGTGTGPSDFKGTIWTGGGSNYTNIAVNAGTGTLKSLPQFSLARYVGTLTPGSYKIGVACVKAGAVDPGTGGQQNFWEVPLTVFNVVTGSFQFEQGWAPATPTLSATAGDSQVTVNFGGLTGNNPTLTSATITDVAHSLSYTLTSTELSTGSGSHLFSSLANGTTYNFTLSAVNGVTPAGTATASATPQVASLPQIPSLTWSADSSTVTLTWGAPSGSTPDFYVVTDETTSVSTNVTALTKTFTGLSADTDYKFKVTAHYPSNPTQAPAFLEVTAHTQPSTIVYQDITVNVPRGLLVLTQRCGTNGYLPTEGAQAGFPGGLGSVNGNGAGGTLTGPMDSTSNATGPKTGGSAPSYNTPAFDYSNPDSYFGQYPYPTAADGTPLDPHYPTRCKIDLGKAKLVTSGPNAGSFLAAEGKIHELTVVDTYADSDNGWTVSAHATDFVNQTQHNGATQSFTSNFLGIKPVVSFVSPPLPTQVGSAYNMSVGANGGYTQGNNNGLGATTPVPLWTALAGHGLGIAQLDARLKLLIPIYATSGDYQSTLAFSAIAS